MKPKVKTKVEKVKAWLIHYKGRIDMDKLHWGGIGHTIFHDYKNAREWLGDEDTYKDRIVPCEITFKIKKE